MEGFFTFVAIVVVVFIVVAVVGSASIIKRQTKAIGKIQDSPKFKAIAEHIFCDGRRPSRIAITYANEIFYGPIEGQFLQVPGTLVPSMSDSERTALGGAFESVYGYSYHPCNRRSSGFGSAPADTGNQYIDTHAECLLISKGSTAGNW